jgi:hypothetical protein
VISVRPFVSLAYGYCTRDDALQVGPTHRTDVLLHEESLRVRMNDAAAECVGPSSKYLMLSVSVDKSARITNVTADAGADEIIASCAATSIRRSRGLETRGPGTLEIGYFMVNKKP